MQRFVHESPRGTIEIRDASAAGKYVVIAIKQEGSSSLMLPPSERQAAAQVLAGDGYRIVPAKDYELTTDAALEKAHDDLRAVLVALELGDHARPYSAHDVLPAIERLRHDASETEKERWRIARNALDRPEPVDPTSVRVGDVVEVEADDSSWMVRGGVADIDADQPYPISVLAPSVGGTVVWPHMRQATVRVLRPAEPEPDPAVVGAMLRALEDADRSLGEREQEDLSALARELVKRGALPPDETDGGETDA